MSKLLNCLINKDISCVPIWFMRQAGRYLPEFKQLGSQNPNFLIDVSNFFLKELLKYKTKLYDFY